MEDPPLVLITAFTLWGIKSTSLLQYKVQFYFILLPVFGTNAFCLKSVFLIALIRVPQRWYLKSMEIMSSASNYWGTFFVIWHGVFSCWKIILFFDPSGCNLAIDSSKSPYNVETYVAKFILSYNKNISLSPVADMQVHNTIEPRRCFMISTRHSALNVYFHARKLHKTCRKLV